MNKRNQKEKKKKKQNYWWITASARGTVVVKTLSTQIHSYPQIIQNWKAEDSDVPSLCSILTSHRKLMGPCYLLTKYDGHPALHFTLPLNSKLKIKVKHKSLHSSVLTVSSHCDQYGALLSVKNHEHNWILPKTFWYVSLHVAQPFTTCLLSCSYECSVKSPRELTHLWNYITQYAQPHTRISCLPTLHIKRLQVLSPA